MPSLIRKLVLVVGLSLVFAGLATVALAESPGSGTSTVAAPAPGSTSATLLNCNPAIEQASRSATFAGQMASVPDAAEMEIRFALSERLPGQTAYHALAAPAFGVWRKSNSGIQVYRYVQQVTNLPAPAAFRATVSFRWLDADGDVLHSSSRRTDVCQQPDERPQLVVSAVHATSGGSGQAQYSIVVGNDGRGPAGPFDVALTVNGTTLPELSVVGLAPAAHAVLQAEGPRCAAGSSVQVTLDAAGQISEAPGGGMPATVACPLTASGSHGGTTGSTGAAGGNGAG